MNPLSVNNRMIHGVMHKLRDKKANDKSLVIMINCFTLKRSF